MRLLTISQAAVITLLLSITCSAGNQTKPISNLTDFSGAVAANPQTPASSKSWQNARQVRTLSEISGFPVLSPDSQILATYRRDEQTSNNNIITLTNINTGKKIHTITYNSPSEIKSFVFSPDGKIFATNIYQGETLTIKLWNVATGQEIQTLRRTVKPKMIQGAAVDSSGNSVIAFSPDGAYLISSSGGNSAIQVWAIAKQKSKSPLDFRFNLTGHTDEITAFAFSPDGKVLATASADKTIKVWNLGTGKLIRTIKANTDIISQLFISPDSQTVASASKEEQSIKLWSLPKGKLIRALPTQGIVTSMGFSPNGNLINIAYKPFISLQTQVWNAKNGKLIHSGAEIGRSKNTTVSIDISPDGKTYAVLGDYIGLQVRDLMTDKTLINFPVEAYQYYSVFYSADGKTLVTEGREGIKIWQ